MLLVLRLSARVIAHEVMTTGVKGIHASALASYAHLLTVEVLVATVMLLLVWVIC